VPSGEFLPRTVKHFLKCGLSHLSNQTKWLLLRKVVSQFMEQPDPSYPLLPNHKFLVTLWPRYPALSLPCSPLPTRHSYLNATIGSTLVRLQTLGHCPEAGQPLELLKLRSILLPSICDGCSLVGLNHPKGGQPVINAFGFLKPNQLSSDSQLLPLETGRRRNLA
jgi:hypothetical protein